MGGINERAKVIKKLSLVLTMAGKGTRTARNYADPKPLITVHGHPLFSWALAGLPFDFANELHIISNLEVSTRSNLKNEVRKYVPDSIPVNLRILKEETSGQAASVMASIADFKAENGILIFNCDTLISNDFPSDYSQFDGLLGTFASNSLNLSYVSSEKNIVSRTAEKSRISNDASSGLYYFGTKNHFEEAFHNTQHVKETYVAPLFNHLINSGLKIGSFKHRAVLPLGTSEEISWFQSLPLNPLDMNRNQP
jgi:NDP-sugar pyrophosphorylase family protein